jgi:CBS domain containing-hemolysin-like protein
MLGLYVSTLAFALRAHSRSRLSGYLPEAQRHRLDWLDRHVAGLLVVVGFTRWVICIALLSCVAAYFLEPDVLQATLGHAAKSLAVGLGLLFIFAIAIPNALARYVGEAILARSLHLLRGLYLALRPIAFAAAGVDFIIMRLLGKTRETVHDESERLEREILNAVSEGEIHGAVDEEQADMIESVFELHDTDVAAIMTPRTDMVAVPADACYERVRQVVLEEGHSRLPVYEESPDHIIGVLYAKDLLAVDSPEAFDARERMRKVPFIPETKKVRDLLNEFRQASVHIAIVLDEYGGTAGLVTIEDILEEVVGEIEDEYDPAEPPPIKRIDDDTLEVDARVHIWEVAEELNVKLPEDGDYETVGGFVFSTLGRIPTSGEQFQHDQVEIRIIDAEPRKINRLLIRAIREPQAA